MAGVGDRRRDLIFVISELYYEVGGRHFVVGGKKRRLPAHFDWAEVLLILYTFLGKALNKFILFALCPSRQMEYFELRLTTLQAKANH